MEDLVILDFNNATVHFYKVDKDTNINDDYIENLGFNINADPSPFFVILGAGHPILMSKIHISSILLK